MSKVTVLNPFSIDPDAHSDSHSLCCEDVSLTVQADVQQSDINFIVKQFGLTHQLPYGTQVPIYDDFSHVPNDFHAAMNFVQESQDSFMALSADVRARFKNDPGAFLDFVSNDANREEAERLGVVTRRPAPAEPGEPQVPKPSPSPDTRVN